MKKDLYYRILSAVESYKYAWCAWHFNNDLSLDDSKHRGCVLEYNRLLDILRAEVEDG